MAVTCGFVVGRKPRAPLEQAAEAASPAPCPLGTTRKQPSRVNHLPQHSWGLPPPNYRFPRLIQRKNAHACMRNVQPAVPC